MGKEILRPREYRIYKPYGKSDGGASAFQVKITLDSEAGPGKTRLVEMFWVAVNQIGTNEATGNAAFGWDDSKQCITMKMGLTDIGELLSLFDGDKEEINLFHKNKAGNTVAKMKQAQNKSGTVYYFQMSSKRGNDLIKVRHNISLSDAKILRQLLKDYVSLYHDWL